MSIERLKAEKRPIWESATRNKANDSSLRTIAKNAAEGVNVNTPSVMRMPSKAENLNLAGDSRKHYGI